MLESHDLKREDAVTLLERLRDVKAPTSPTSPQLGGSNNRTVALTSVADGLVHCWEFGPPYPFLKVIEFMTMTGSLPKYAVQAQAQSLQPMIER